MIATVDATVPPATDNTTKTSPTTHASAATAASAASETASQSGGSGGGGSGGGGGGGGGACAPASSATTPSSATATATATSSGTSATTTATATATAFGDDVFPVAETHARVLRARARVHEYARETERFALIWLIAYLRRVLDHVRATADMGRFETAVAYPTVPEDFPTDAEDQLQARVCDRLVNPAAPEVMTRTDVHEYLARLVRVFFVGRGYKVTHHSDATGPDGRVVARNEFRVSWA